MILDLLKNHPRFSPSLIFLNSMNNNQVNYLIFPNLSFNSGYLSNIKSSSKIFSA